MTPALRASSVERAAACPGSRALEAAQPADDRSKDSAAGDKAHAIVAAYFQSFEAHKAWPPPPANPTEPEEEVAADFIVIVQSVFSTWFGPRSGVPTKYVEEEIVWNDDNFDPILTGHPDLYFIDGNRALICDLKSLWGEHTESVRNYQLRAYARLVQDLHGVEEVTCSIIQPRVSHKPQLCVYDYNDLEVVRAELNVIDARSKEANAPLVPGEKQCKFCLCLTTCPASIGCLHEIANLYDAR